MGISKTVLWLFFFIAILQTQSLSQGKWKAGIGLNYISNNLDEEYLDSYLAPSFNLGYTFLRKSKFSMGVELDNALKLKQDEISSRVGFTTSLPLMVNLDSKKLNYHLGAGPAYHIQHSKVYGTSYSISGAYVNYTGGIGIKGKPILSGLLYPEYTLRISYFSSFKSRELDAGMLSFIIFLRGT
jgi:hypothetical protein